MSNGTNRSGRDWPIKYGKEYDVYAQDGNVKYIKPNIGEFKTPKETISKNRVYAVLDDQNDVKSIVFFDRYGEREKQIDVKGKPHNGKLPHVHIGYEHNEIGDRGNLTEKEASIVLRILNTWERRRKRLQL